MNKVAVHIGLPKTATTTLQQKVFPAHPGIRYLGPRAEHPEFDQVMSEPTALRMQSGMTRAHDALYQTLARCSPVHCGPL